MTIQNDNLTVEVYSADYRVLYRVPWQEAVRLILRQAVFIVDPREPAVHVRSPSLTVELPMSVALRAYVHIPYQAGNRVTRVGVLQRDRYTCAYCGGYGNTIDHVIPESRGGEKQLVQPGCSLRGVQRAQRRSHPGGGRDASALGALRASGTRSLPGSGPGLSLHHPWRGGRQFTESSTPPHRHSPVA